MKSFMLYVRILNMLCIITSYATSIHQKVSMKAIGYKPPSKVEAVFQLGLIILNSYSSIYIYNMTYTY